MHAAVAAHLMDDDLPHRICDDRDAADLDPRWTALLDWVDKVNDAAWEIGPDDVAAAGDAGCTQEDLYEAATVAALFNFFNRWIDAAGVEAPPEGFYEKHLEAQGDIGYRMD